MRSRAVGSLTGCSGAKADSAVRWRLQKKLDRTLDRWVRRGPRVVLWTQPTAHLGNFLYEWMHAFRMQQQGVDMVCLRTPAMESWLPVFGERAATLLVPPDELRLRDRRERGLHNEFGLGFNLADLAEFFEGFMEPSGVLDADRVPFRLRTGTDGVVVNVRRGDYFNDPANRAKYAFDVHEYLRGALAASRRVGGDIRKLVVVSDGIEWCAKHLAWLGEHCEELVWEDEGLPPATHLAILANAPRLILANSTFSYWGGYASRWRFGDPTQVVAPWFHVRTDLGGAAWQLDPEWSVVRDIPSGWALPPSESA